MSNKNRTLGEFIIENQTEFKYSSGELSRLINSIRLAAKVVNHEYYWPSIKTPFPIEIFQDFSGPILHQKHAIQCFILALSDSVPGKYKVDTEIYRNPAEVK